MELKAPASGNSETMLRALSFDIPTIFNGPDDQNGALCGVVTTIYHPEFEKKFYTICVCPV
jgi:hypothetical protein